MTAVMMLGMGYFGVRLKGIEQVNNVHWSASGPGLIFDRYAMAYTDGFFPTTEQSTGGLTIEIAIQPDFIRHSNFSFILLIHDGDDERQLVIGQWRKSLLIMNGDDYSNERRVPKIYLPLEGKAPQLISIVSSDWGTKVFLDGIVKIIKSDLFLHYPLGSSRTRLVVGNSLHGRNPWMGLFQGLAMFDHALQDEMIQRHYHQWKSKKQFEIFKADAPRLLYAFQEGSGERVFDQAGSGVDLIIPGKLEILEKKALAWPNLSGVAIDRLLEDVSINFLGFIPLGFLLYATLSRIEKIRVRQRAIVAILVAGVFSLCIEVAQVWIPTRDSSMLDLILNALGGGIGAYLGFLRL